MAVARNGSPIERPFAVDSGDTFAAPQPAGADRLRLVFVAPLGGTSGGAEILTMSSGGVSMARVPGARINATIDVHSDLEIWYAVGLAEDADADLVYDTDSGTVPCLVVQDYTGVDQTDPFVDLETALWLTQELIATITLAALGTGEMAVGVCFMNNSFTVVPNGDPIGIEHNDGIYSGSDFQAQDSDTLNVLTWGEEENFNAGGLAIGLILRAAGAGPVESEADVAYTEANDTASSGATTAIGTSLTSTEANDTLSSGATEAVVATSAYTEANDTVSSGATSAIVATSTYTESNDTLSSGATAAEAATATYTEQNDTLASGATLALTTTSTYAEAADTLSSAIAVAIVVSATYTEANDTLDATADADDSVAATCSYTEANDTLSSAAVTPIAVTSIYTESNDTLASLAVGPDTIIVDAAYTEANDNVASATLAVVVASGNYVEANDTASSTSTIGISATATMQELNDALTASTAAVVLASVGYIEANDLLVSGVYDPNTIDPEEARIVYVASQVRLVEILAQSRTVAVDASGRNVSSNI